MTLWRSLDEHRRQYRQQQIPPAFRQPVQLIPAREAIPPCLDADRLGDGIVPACTTLDGPS